MYVCVILLSLTFTSNKARFISKGFPYVCKQGGFPIQRAELDRSPFATAHINDKQKSDMHLIEAPYWLEPFILTLVFGLRKESGTIFAHYVYYKVGCHIISGNPKKAVTVFILLNELGPHWAKFWEPVFSKDSSTRREIAHYDVVFVTQRMWWWVVGPPSTPLLLYYVLLPWAGLVLNTSSCGEDSSIRSFPNILLLLTGVPPPLYSLGLKIGLYTRQILSLLIVSSWTCQILNHV